ncbi:hypothetical protein SKAU_G00114110 [Synaphobranchus kaupii]|uniref:Urotensin II n=1 Tax=Synaphobranchus kaupii TaxID=118154 RepID=A0A9Q1G1U1_SYNKA|nr:hypothetical protein SKAU_G00114110 [Synaphobranchus kaupii]
MRRIPLLTWTLLFSTMGVLLAHPISEPSEMRYTEPVLAMDGAAISAGEFFLSDLTSPSGTGQGFPSLLTEERNRDGLRSAAFIPVGSVVNEGLQEAPGPLHPFRRFLGPRKPYEKRGNRTECFWKYCV